MATTNTASSNQFSLVCFIATEPSVTNFQSSSVARYALSLARREKTADGQEVRKSVLLSAETWSKDANSDLFALIKKGNLVQVTGYLKPENYTDREGNARERVTFVCTTITPASRKAEDPAEAPAKKSNKSSTKSLGSAKNTEKAA